MKFIYVEKQKSDKCNFRKEIAMKILCNNTSPFAGNNKMFQSSVRTCCTKSLEGIKFKLENSVLELTGYDLEIGIKTVIPVKSDDSGEFILNARLFAEMIRKMPSKRDLIGFLKIFR